jgi:hypothetical protein
MIGTLCWKEYREQRGLWLAIALLAVLLAVGLGSLARGGLGGLASDTNIRPAVLAVLFSLMIAQGVVCGAHMLAGEKEAGTLAFLDVLASQRYPLWRTKLVAGSLLTLAQAVAIFALMWTMNLGPWSYLPLLAVLGLLAFLWGMVGGAVCEHVFPAVVTGIVLAFGSVGLSVLVPVGMPVVQILLAVVALFISKQYFCDRDALRVAQATRAKSGQVERGPPSWIALFWLIERQGLRLALAGLGVSLLAGFFMFPAPDLLYPAATLLIGLVCGVAVFASEQSGEQERFLGAQRVPPGRMWLMKNWLWGLAALSWTGLLMIAMALRHEYSRDNQSTAIFTGLAEFMMRDQRLLFMFIFMLHGYCFGQFFGLLSRKVVVAGVLAGASAILVLALWLPSLVFGGLPGWRMLAIPLLLLVAVRLSMWPWFSGRLFTRNHVLGLLGCGMFSAAWLGSNLWYRSVEVPDVGPPFDVAAFEADLRRAANSEAGPTLRRAAKSLIEFRKKLKSPPLTKPLFPLAKDQKAPEYLQNGNYAAACYEILEKGWPPEDKEIGAWLDALFAGDWVEDFQAGVKMPLGLMVDPRTYRESVPWQQEIDGCRDIATLVNIRVLQLQLRGQNQVALDELANLLALARQLRNDAPTFCYLTGRSVESTALVGMSRWLHNVGPEPELLRKALNILRSHEQDTPSVLDTLKADYMVSRHERSYFLLAYSAEVQKKILLILWEVPWERERLYRLSDALYHSRFHRLQRPSETRRKEREQYPDRYSAIAFESGLPLADGPTAVLTPPQWGRLISGSSPFLPWTSLSRLQESANVGLAYVRACQLQLALALYQIDHAGAAAPDLAALTPRYLPKIPIDPIRERRFEYKISTGEKVTGQLFTGEYPRLENFLPGQGVIVLNGKFDPANSSEIVPLYFLVPVRKKE